jgi:predicted HicB family RNase H-like nuclease
MPLSEKKKLSNDKYIKNTFDSVVIRVPKGRKQAIQDVAQAQGESLNGFVNTAIDERVERLQIAQQAFGKGE